MDFVWRHKGALAVGTILAAFPADPGPFLAGTRDLGAIAAEAVVRPAAEASGRVAVELVSSSGVRWLLAAGLTLCVLYAAYRCPRRGRSR